MEAGQSGPETGRQFKPATKAGCKYGLRITEAPTELQWLHIADIEQKSTKIHSSSLWEGWIMRWPCTQDDKSSVQSTKIERDSKELEKWRDNE